MSKTESRGSSDSKGSWNMTCMSRRTSRSCLLSRWLMSLPSKTTLPAVGSSSRVIARMNEVFPQPDSPTKAMISLWSSVSEIPSTARTTRWSRAPRRLWYSRARSLTSSTGGAAVLTRCAQHELGAVTGCQLVRRDLGQQGRRPRGIARRRCRSDRRTGSPAEG